MNALRTARLAPAAVLFLVMASGCGTARQEDYAREEARLNSLTRDYRARSYYQRRNATIASNLLTLARHAESLKPDETVEQRPDYAMALFLYGLVRPSLPDASLPAVPDQRDVAAGLRTAARQPPPAIHGLLGVGFVFSLRFRFALYELRDLDVAGLEPVDQWLVRLCRAYLYNELRLTLHREQALSAVRKCRAQHLPAEFETSTAMVLLAMDARRRDWQAVARALPALRRETPHTPLVHLLSLATALADAIDQAPKRQRARLPLARKELPRYTEPFAEPWIRRRLQRHLDTPYTSRALRRIARDSELWLHVVERSLLDYAARHPALAPVQRRIEHGKFLATGPSEKSRQPPRPQRNGAGGA